MYVLLIGAVFLGVQRDQSSWASQSDGPQEKKNDCSISPPSLKKEK